MHDHSQPEFLILGISGWPALKRVRHLKTDQWARVIQYWYNWASKGFDHQGQEGIDEAERPLGKNWEARCVVNHVPPPCSTCWLPHNLTLDRGFTIVNTTVFYHPSPTRNNAHMAVSIHFFPQHWITWKYDQETMARKWSADPDMQLLIAVRYKTFVSWSSSNVEDNKPGFVYIFVQAQNINFSTQQLF